MAKKTKAPDSLSTIAILAAKMKAKRSRMQRAADTLTGIFGTVGFLIFNIALFLVWILLNIVPIPGIPMIDPFPFFLLTTVVSLEAIFLSIIVLISENRAARVAELREEMDFQINVQAEREITKILHLMDELRTDLKLRRKADPELMAMKESIDVEKLGEQLEEEIL